MKSQYAQQIRRCATEWFKEHKAAFSEVGADTTRIQRLRWQEPGTSTYWIDYIISGHFLLVYGDAGDAIYAWSENITWDFLKTTDVDYFKSKCQASEVGRDYRQWDARKLVRDFENHFKEMRVPPRDREEILSCCRMSSCADELHRMAIDEPIAWEKTFGQDYHEYIEWGWTVNCRCIGHWVGIQMATGNTEAMLKRYEV